jgi:hypothetical protein
MEKLRVFYGTFLARAFGEQAGKKCTGKNCVLRYRLLLPNLVSFYKQKHSLKVMLLTSQRTSTFGRLVPASTLELSVPYRSTVMLIGSDVPDLYSRESMFVSGEAQGVFAETVSDFPHSDKCRYRTFRWATAATFKLIPCSPGQCTAQLKLKENF